MKTNKNEKDKSKFIIILLQSFSEHLLSYNFLFSYPFGSISTIKKNKGIVKYRNSIKLVGTRTKLAQRSQRINFIAFSLESTK